MTATTSTDGQISSWFNERLPAAWQHEPVTYTIDREEITVRLTIADVDSDTEDLAAAREGRAAAFRDDTRGQRIEIAQEAERRYGAPVSWGLDVGDHSELWTHLAAPVMTRLRQPQRQVLDTLVDAGVARSRSDALAWCVRLVGQHEGDWLTELRTVMGTVEEVRSRGPRA